MSDINRQAAIDTMCKLMRHWFGDNPKDEIREIKRELEKLPSAQSEHNPDDERKITDLHKMVNYLLSQLEQRWIPCSERLPEDSQFVLMTIRRMNEHYNHEPFISVGYISWNQSAWWCAHDGDCKSNDVRVDAWMPLPEPYRESDETK